MRLQLNIAEEKDLANIHEASIKILGETGHIFHSEKARETLKKHGAKIEGKTVYFHEDLIMRAMKTVPATFQWRARNPAFSTVIGEGGFRLAPNAGNIYVQDLDEGRRLANLEDVRKIQSIHQMSDVVDFVGNNPCDPSDINPSKRHLFVTYETLKHTDKPLVSYFASQKNQISETLEMVTRAFGEDDVLANHHVVGTGVASTSPLSYSADVLRVITGFAEHNQPVMITTAAMGGISGPLDLMGIGLQQNAELLAGTVYVQLLNPGNPVVWGPSSTVGWMKTANYSTGTPEAMLPNILILQMANDFYKVPTRSMAGLTDSKAVDCQSGYETMQNLMLAMLGGAQIIYESLGVLDNILTTSYEKIIIDEELFQRNVRIHRGMDLSDLSLPLKLIQEIGGGGEYLTHTHTLEHFRDMWSPKVSNWENYDEWEKSGYQDSVVMANKVWKERLNNATETFLTAEADKNLIAFIESHI